MVSPLLLCENAGTDIRSDADADADVSSSEDVLAPEKSGAAPRKVRKSHMVLCRYAHRYRQTASRKKATSTTIKDNIECDGELSDPDNRGTLYLRTRAQTRHVHAKPKCVPIHLQWSEDSGSESDPDIIAPGWNLPQQRSRAKAKKEESESEIDLARRPRTLGGSRRN
jgi:hypothetical protein